MKDEIQIKVVKKGKSAILPINGAGYSFAQTEAKENGIVITFGHRGVPGVFIPEEILRKAFAKFEKEIK